MRRAAVLLAAVIASAVSGCGTFCNVIPEPHKIGPPGPRPLKVYGGVQTDCEALATAFQGGQTPSLGPVAKVLEASYIAGMGACVLVDLPLSALADTLTLPCTIPASLRNQRDKRGPEAPGREKTGPERKGASGSAADTPRSDVAGIKQDPAAWEQEWFGPREKP
jgi:uncharacterized protein YceK